MDMFATQRPQSPQLPLGFVRGRHRRGVPDRSFWGTRHADLGLHLKAAWHGITLDGELAAGADPQTSAVLALRARQLTGHRGRKRVADGLAGALRRATDTRPGITAAIRPDGRELLDARVVLTALERRLRRSEAVTAQGVAMLGGLLTDAESSLYRPTGRGELASRLRAAAAALEPPTTRRACEIPERAKAVVDLSSLDDTPWPERRTSRGQIADG